MITKFVGNATLWVSDSWLPGGADAGWLVPIDQYKTPTAYNADASDFCNQSMIYKGSARFVAYGRMAHRRRVLALLLMVPFYWPLIGLK